MVPDKFDMVDMEGIDLIESQGETVEGLYQKLVESIAQCRYQCLYNWKFDGILIPPSYVEMEVRENGVWINEGVSVDEEDVIHIYSIEPEPPAPIEPVIQQLDVTENGTYVSPSGVDGYNPVVVNVPAGALIGDTPPTQDIGNVGDYYIERGGYEGTFTYGITITKAARGSNKSFTYWGARDIQLVFENDNGETLELKDIQNKQAWRAVGDNSFSDLSGIINGQLGSYYETNGLPGYIKIRAEIPRGYFLTKLRVCLRNDSNYRDFWATFTLNQWTTDKNNIGSTLVSVVDSVASDWDFGADVYTEFNIPDVYPISSPSLYYKEPNGWVFIK